MRFVAGTGVDDVDALGCTLLFLDAEVPMNTLFTVVAWCILFVLCWPLALLALVLWPLFWLVSLPFRLVGIAVGSVFALLRALLFLPARVLGVR